MNKLAAIIEGLGPDDLVLIRKDLLAGNIERLIEKRLHGMQKLERQCPVCSGSIGKNALVLEFGEDYLRRKAYFDGVDCMEYFLRVHIRASARRLTENR